QRRRPPAPGPTPSAPPAGPAPTPRLARPRRNGGSALLQGAVAAWLAVIVARPLIAVAARSISGGPAAFFEAITAPKTVAALQLTLLASLAIVVINAVAGTLIAWVLVRDDFRGKGVVDAVIDLPFALPTIVAGLTLIALYGPKSPMGLNLAYTRAGILLALLFITLPFVVRQVQPVLAELDREMEEAAHALGATPWTTFRTVMLPNLVPAIVSGAGLAFARAVGEFGSVVLISGNIPFRTEVASVAIFNQIENDDTVAAAAISIVLLALSLVILGAIALFERRATRHERPA
ncbi:MAG: sulfate ABC transporter permease subunit CysT, partial [Chloroflexota bacterium]